jgi:hypothetical protein
MIPVTAERRGKELSKDQKFRVCFVSEWTPNVSSKYTVLVTEAFHKLASQQLASLWKEADLLGVELTKTDSSLFTEDGLLAYAARCALSGRLTMDNISAWWSQSQMKKELSAKYPEAVIVKFLQTLTNIASPVPNYTVEAAERRIALFAEFESDLTHPICQQMIARLHSRIADLKAVAEGIGEPLPEALF